MTLDQAVAHLDAIRQANTASAKFDRDQGDWYKRAANDAVDPDLRRIQFESSSGFYAAARSLERDAEAIALVLAALPVGGRV